MTPCLLIEPYIYVLKIYLYFSIFGKISWNNFSYLFQNTKIWKWISFGIQGENSLTQEPSENETSAPVPPLNYSAPSVKDPGLASIVVNCTAYKGTTSDETKQRNSKYSFNFKITAHQIVAVCM